MIQDPSIYDFLPGSHHGQTYDRPDLDNCDEPSDIIALCHAGVQAPG